MTKAVVKKLEAWDAEPIDVFNDGVDKPKYSAIMCALVFARHPESFAFDPDTCVPDPNGGIALSRRNDDLEQVLHVYDSKNIEYQIFVGTKLRHRHNIEIHWTSGP